MNKENLLSLLNGTEVFKTYYEVVEQLLEREDKAEIIEYLCLQLPERKAATFLFAMGPYRTLFEALASRDIDKKIDLYAIGKKYKDIREVSDSFHSEMRKARWAKEKAEILKNDKKGFLTLIQDHLEEAFVEGNYSKEEVLAVLRQQINVIVEDNSITLPQKVLL